MEGRDRRVDSVLCRQPLTLWAGLCETKQMAQIKFFPYFLSNRAKTILSGTLIRPYDDDPNSTKLTILLQNDPMGWIPKFMVNMLASRAPIEWQERLSKFYHDVYIKEKGQQQTASEK